MAALLRSAEEPLYILGHWGVAIGKSLAGIRTRVTDESISSRTCRGVAAIMKQHRPPHPIQALHPACTCCSSKSSPSCLCSGKRFSRGLRADRSRDRSRPSPHRSAAESLRKAIVLTSSEGTRSRTARCCRSNAPVFNGAESASASGAGRDQGGVASMKKGSPIVRAARVSVRIGAPRGEARQDLSD